MAVAMVTGFMYSFCSRIHERPGFGDISIRNAGYEKKAGIGKYRLRREQA
jgi:hypothetical protein